MPRTADLALMGGPIPGWLFRRMKTLSRAIVEAILIEQGREGFLRRLSDPFWFQSFGAVIGMDWNSSGVTTAVMRALKSSLNPHAKELGLYVCGGKGKESLKTPSELLRVGERTGIDGDLLARSSKLSAKVDNTAVQDGHQLYVHNFVVSEDGDWCVIQQGMDPANRSARRYHWHSEGLDSYVKSPHAAICGDHQGEILNLADRRAEPAHGHILDLSRERVTTTLREVVHMNLPKHYGVKAGDVDLKRLGTVLALSQEQGVEQFEELLLLKGLGPKTLRSLALVSEVIHGDPVRFSDPARFSFAHGGKGAKPFPILQTVYDETIATLRDAVDQAKIGESDKQKALAALTRRAQKAEETFTPSDYFDELVDQENADAWKHGGRTLDGPVQPPSGQLELF